MTSINLIQTVQSPNPEPVKGQASYRDKNRISRAVKSALILIAMFWRLPSYSVHMLTNLATGRSVDSTHSKWHLNQVRSWEGLKEVQRNVAYLRWLTKNEKVDERKIVAPGIFRIFTRALWYSPTKQREDSLS